MLDTKAFRQRFSVTPLKFLAHFIKHFRKLIKHHFLRTFSFVEQPATVNVTFRR